MSKSIEADILEYEDFDQFDSSMMFMTATLKRDFGPFKAGEKFECITFDYENSIFEFHRDHSEENIRKFKMSIDIGEEIHNASENI